MASLGASWTKQERMIAFELTPEPAIFEERVRARGNQYLAPLLAAGAVLKSKHFKNRDYWVEVRPHLRLAFRRICAYSGFFIEGEGEVDHFVAKTRNANLAYEWSNYRFACTEMNRKKSSCKDNILDPFQVQEGWFEISITDGFLLRPTNQIDSPELRKLAEDTIVRLDLNRSTYTESRENWATPYLDSPEFGELFFQQLVERAPLVAMAVKKYWLDLGHVVPKNKE